MILKSKICGISDSKILYYITNHNYPPQFVGFIVNYPKSNRYIELKKLKELLKVQKNNSFYVAVLVNPNHDILEKIKDLPFDYYQLYDCDPIKIQLIREKYKKKIITPGIRLGSNKFDQKRVLTPKQAYKNGSDWLVIGRPITKGNIKKNIQTLIDHLNQ